MRKYSHESKSEAAYRVSAALFQARTQLDARSSNMEPIVQSMAKSGFTCQANMLLSASKEVDPRNGTLPFDLAWKTGSWSLPLPPDESRKDGSTATYAILRALEHETSSSHAQVLLQHSLEVQALQIASISHQNPLPDREAVGSLLLLHEIDRSRMDPVARKDIQELKKLPYVEFSLVLYSCFALTSGEQLSSVRPHLVGSTRPPCISSA